MVTKSTVDYDKFKDEVKQIYLSKFPKKEKYIEEFMNYVSDVYDDHRRIYFPYKLMWLLYNRKQRVKKNQHFWIAFIGQKGGEGKSTLAKQVLHFLDKSFDSKRIGINYEQFIKIVYRSKRVDNVKYPSILMDEVEIKTHQLSKEGRKLRDIITKIRQLNLFVGVCANSLSDVPPFIYDRLTCVFYLNDKHRFDMWDLYKDKPKYSIITDIKDEWKKIRHGAFLLPNIKKRAFFKNQGFSNELPFDDSKYLDNKEEDLFNDIEGFVDVTGEEEKKEAQIEPRLTKEELLREVMKNNPNVNYKTISSILNCSLRHAYRVKERVLTLDRDKNTNTMSDGGKVVEEAATEEQHNNCLYVNNDEVVGNG